MKKVVLYLSLLAFAFWLVQIALAAYLDLTLNNVPMIPFIIIVLISQVFLLIILTFHAKLYEGARHRVGLFKDRLWIAGINGFLIVVIQYGQSYLKNTMEYYGPFWILGIITLYLVYRNLPVKTEEKA